MTAENIGQKFNNFTDSVKTNTPIIFNTCKEWCGRQITHAKPYIQSALNTTSNGWNRASDWAKTPRGAGTLFLVSGFAVYMIANLKSLAPTAEVKNSITPAGAVTTDASIVDKNWKLRKSLEAVAILLIFAAGVAYIAGPSVVTALMAV